MSAGTTKVFDAIVLGGGHNGLTAAAYLAEKICALRIFDDDEGKMIEIVSRGKGAAI